MDTIEGEASKDNALLQEYADTGDNMRHYGNLQFAQFTIYCAIAAAIASQLFGEHPIEGRARILVCLIASVLGVLFWFMSERASEYWNARVERAKEIERKLGITQYQKKPAMRFISNRQAVSFSYATFVVGFVAAIFV